jgi:RimJ/RimL family protein N-acetyltransferase
MLTERALIGERLPEDVLARRASLPRLVAPVTLVGTGVRLQPLVPERDVAGLYAVSNGQPARLGVREIGEYDADELIWRYLAFGPFAAQDDMLPYLRTLVSAPDGLALCVVDLPSGRPAGVVTFMSNVPAHLKIELGNIWYSPLLQRSGANLEATYLMLRHAFGLGYRRVEWKCNALNERSRRAALRMGFRFEGIQEAHMIIKGRNRDTAWFRILADEWPAVRDQLEGMLAAD